MPDSLSKSFTPLQFINNTKIRTIDLLNDNSEHNNSSKYNIYQMDNIVIQGEMCICHFFSNELVILLLVGISVSELWFYQCSQDL
jgi:hypothetical protein